MKSPSRPYRQSKPPEYKMIDVLACKDFPDLDIRLVARISKNRTPDYQRTAKKLLKKIKFDKQTGSRIITVRRLML
jgi:hypothetical protein